MDQFKKHLAKLLEGEGKLAEAERHLLKSGGGKFVRPQFLFALAELLEIEITEVMDYAVAVELIHTATLMHDDVVDHTTERRGNETTHSRYGNETAVLAGDRLLARALQLFARSPRPEWAVAAAAEAFAAMAKGAAAELEHRDRTDVDQETLLMIADGKTGALFALCGELAGIAAGNSDARRDLAQFGLLLGRTFQLMDDVDDITEDERDGTPTLARLVGAEAARTLADASFEQAMGLIEQYRDRPAYESLMSSAKKFARL